MKRFQLFALLLVTTLLQVVPAVAATIDMNDPLRAVGREYDVRVDAQLVTGRVTPGSPIGVVYQIQNFGSSPVAIAPSSVSAEYDGETGVITLGIGSEVPDDGKMPQVELIAPGAQASFRTAAMPIINAGTIRAGFASGPRLIQIKVSILRDTDSFADLIAARSRAPLSDELFEKWFEATATIFLNTLPVHYAPRTTVGAAERRSSRGGY